MVPFLSILLQDEWLGDPMAIEGKCELSHEPTALALVPLPMGLTRRCQCQEIPHLHAVQLPRLLS
jgi:hypothetical protein